jgi:hypothetical protein
MKAWFFMWHIELRRQDVHARPSQTKNSSERFEVFGVVVPNIPKVSSCAIRIERSTGRLFLIELLMVFDRSQNGNESNLAVKVGSKEGWRSYRSAVGIHEEKTRAVLREKKRQSISICQVECDGCGLSIVVIMEDVLFGYRNSSDVDRMT